MTRERFGQLWDALVTGRPRKATGASSSAPPITNGVSKETIAALVAYGKGEKRHFEFVREQLKSSR